MASKNPQHAQISLSDVIDRDIMAADFIVSMFWSAMTSFRHDSILRPFPEDFIDEVGAYGIKTAPHKDIETLVSTKFYWVCILKCT